LNNVVKHAGADEVVVAIRAATQEFVIEIRDNGCGYRNDAPGGGTAVAGVRATGMGVESIRQRMTGIGGTFEIAPAKDGGTVVTLTMLFARGTS
jgi:signal transduction histidine kinase